MGWRCQGSGFGLRVLGSGLRKCRPSFVMILLRCSEAYQVFEVSIWCLFISGLKLGSCFLLFKFCSGCQGFMFLQKTPD